MGILSDIFGTGEENSEKNSEENKHNQEASLLLRKEELDINKTSMQTGEVELSKEVIEEQKTVDVPVKHEEVVIERRTLNNELSDTPITDEETIRIPVSEEKVDIEKRTVVTGEVTAFKRDVEETRHFDETLKREEARVNKIGNPDILENQTDQKYE